MSTQASFTLRGWNPDVLTCIAKGFKTDEGNIWFERLERNWGETKCIYCGAPKPSATVPRDWKPTPTPSSTPTISKPASRNSSEKICNSTSSLEIRRIS
jgi:hypothetical protein